MILLRVYRPGSSQRLIYASTSVCGNFDYVFHPMDLLHITKAWDNTQILVPVKLMDLTTTTLSFSQKDKLPSML